MQTEFRKGVGTLMIVSFFAVSSLAADEPRNQWYRESRVWVHFDNHSSPLGKGLTPDDLTAMLGTIPADMLQVSAQSNTYATYPTTVGWNHPQAEGYDTIGTFREVTRRLGRRFCLYMSVDRRPVQLAEHPEWSAIDAQGKPMLNSEPIVCQRPNRQGKGYLYEQFLPQIRELVRLYDPDGFWFDGDYILTRPCWCPNCLAEWQVETGKEAPRDANSPDWRQWLDWHRERYRAYRQAVAEAIHEASPKALYTSNWSWAWTPEPVPAYVDTLSGDAWNIRQVVCVTQRWGAQQQTPWDVMSFCVPSARTFRDYSLQRTLQEGAMTMASGGVWCLWAFGGESVPAAGVEIARHAAEFARERDAALGPSVSLAQVAVLDSETTWEAGDRARAIDGPAHTIARALLEAHYFTDIVNEVTFRQRLTPYRVVVLPDCRSIAPETLSVLKAFAEEGGLVLAVGAALRGTGENEPADSGEFLGLTRRAKSGRQVLRLGRGRNVLGDLWEVNTDTAGTIAVFADGTPALTIREQGRGKVAYFASGEMYYPDDALYADVLAALGYGPSYRVLNAPADAAIVCTLRRRGEDMVLHCVDLTTRVNGINADVDTLALTEWNPIRRTAVLLDTDQLPIAPVAVPCGVRTDARLENGRLRVAFTDWQTHAAAVLRFPAPVSIGLLPADTPQSSGVFHPESEQGGLLFRDDFEELPVGRRPVAPWKAEVRGATDIVAVAEAATGRHCLRFHDTEDSSFWPFLHRSFPAFRRGAATLNYELRVGSEADCLVELRYEGKGPGPSIRLDSEGRLSHAGQELAVLKPDTWHRFRIEIRLGDEKPGFDLTVTPDGGEPLVFSSLTYASEWFFLCNSVYFVGSGNRVGDFFLDNVRFERGLSPGR